MITLQEHACLKLLGNQLPIVTRLIESGPRNFVNAHGRSASVEAGRPYLKIKECL